MLPARPRARRDASDGGGRPASSWSRSSRASRTRPPRRPRERSSSRESSEPRRRRSAASSSALFDEVRRAIERTFEYAGPGYLAYIPGGGLYTAALAEFLAQGVNRYVGVWQPSPAVVQIEENVTRWLCDVFDYPGRVAGHPHVGRFDREPLRHRHRPPREARRGLPRRHVLRQRAGARERRRRPPRSPGSPGRNLRIVPTDDRAADGPRGACGRRSPRTARPASARSWWRRAPARPTPGRSTRSTTIADVAAEEGLWMHVDAAYGGFFRLTERGRARVPRASSARTRSRSTRTRGCSCPTARAGWWCATAQALRDAHFEGAAYLQDLPPTGELPELQRVLARALARLRGACACGSRCGCTAWPRSATPSTRSSTSPSLLARGVRGGSATSRCCGGHSSRVVAVPPRRRRPTTSERGELLRRINASKRVFLSSTLVRGEYVLRAVHRVAPHASRPASTSASRSSRTRPRELAAR